MKARNCDCDYADAGTKTLCLYHWGWAKLIDEARAVMANDESWTRRATEVPSTDLFPLDAPGRKIVGLPVTQPGEPT